jgi:hypothetical protein
MLRLNCSNAKMSIECVAKQMLITLVYARILDSVMLVVMIGLSPNG